MAHEIATINGRDAYIGRDAAWHVLGRTTGKHFSSAELQADGALDFDVFKSQLHDGRGQLVDAWGTFRWDRQDKLDGNMDAAVFLGTVGRDYRIIHHREGVRIVDALMGEREGAHYETAGTLNNGAKVWALADLNLAMNIGDDKHRTYLLFATAHDGTMGHQYRLVNERVVCANTMGMAMSEKTKGFFSVRHTKNAQVRLDNAHAALENIADDVMSMESKLNYLANKRVTRDMYEAVMNKLFPRIIKDEGEKQINTRRDNVLLDVLNLYRDNDDNAFPEQAGSSYNLLNAITNYADHARISRSTSDSDDKTEVSRANSALFGTGNTLKTQAFEIITQHSKDLSPMRLQVAVRDDASMTTGSSLLDEVCANA